MRAKNLYLPLIIAIVIINILIYQYNFKQTSFSEKCELTISEKWNEIFNVSDEQKLIPPDVIIETAKFMIQEVNEDDPALIAFVKSLIKPPSTKPKTLNDKNRKDFSQIGQSKFIDGLLKQKKDGFFIESGGYDGETFSNSLFFELERNWSGLLIEPIPYLYNLILTKNRNIHVINACISGKKPMVKKFRNADSLSGSLDEMNSFHKSRIDREMNNKVIWVYVPCFPLSTILKAINVEKIDYFSLDIEGGEWSVIESIDFNKIDIEAMTVEWSANPATKDNIIDKLNKGNYKVVKDDGDLYLKKEHKNKTNS